MSYTNGLDKPSDYFNTKIFTGDNSANNSVTGVGFQPDFIWFKNRNAANDHALVDSVRGRKALSSNNASAELTLNADKDFQSFDSDGFTVDVVEQLNSFNKSGDSLVSWNWVAGTSFTNDASGTGIGSIDSAGSVNTDAGFSIISYTGTGSVGTIAHGLGAVPSMYILKRRAGSTENWPIYHQSVGNTHALYLNTTDAIYDYANFTNDTSPTSSVFTVGGSNDQANPDGSTMIAYCFAEKKGYSKFGSYTGNGNADGTFVYTGFAPAFFILKRTDETEQWIIKDNKRPGYNPNNTLYANLTNTEDTGSSVYGDFVSNGVKLRGTYNGMNASGASYIYMAFAENPFVTSSGVPATAR